MKVLTRMRAMGAEEIRFRLACEARKATELVRARVAPRKWRRGDLAHALAAPSPADSAPLLAARRALSAGDFLTAHLELSRHFSARESRFTLDPRTLPELVRRITVRFPDAASDATRRADRMRAGLYDLLGYEGIPFGTPPRWHSDPVHGREAPEEYWSSIPYLDRELGDHKIIWEINRHQHWLTLARAYHLSGDTRYYREVVDQLENWMAANPPLRGINWASMLELAFRTISWTWALHLFTPAGRDDSGDVPWVVDLLLGLDTQLQHVENNLSRYFSPNTHLIGEGLALYVVSAAFPELRASSRRLELGRRVLIEELERQVHADGGHAELSAHYHRYATDFYVLALSSALVTGDPAATLFARGVRKLSTYLRCITDDRGQLPLIGDDDGGRLFPICARRPSDCRDTLAAAAAILGEQTLLVSEVPEEVFWSCGLLPLDELRPGHGTWPSTALRQSGYYVSRDTQGDHLVFDAGRHGFLNGGHAHADALSVVLTVAGRPLLVDNGTATYTTDPALRDRFRTTAMHNTVVIDGRSQSQPRGPFHWWTTTDARAPVWVSAPTFDYVEGNHDGYAPIVHSRSVLAVHGFGWILVDHVLGDQPASAEAFWHVHPDWTVRPGSHGVALHHQSGAVVAMASTLRLEILTPDTADGLDAYAPVYGSVERATCLRARADAPLPQSFATFVAADGGRTALPSLDVQVTPVALTHPLPAGWHGAAFRIAAADREALLLTSVERIPSATAASPKATWGTALARTDARAALVYLDGATDPPILVGGSRVEHQMASSVHS